MSTEVSVRLEADQRDTLDERSPSDAVVNH